MPADMNEALMRALAFDPAQRFADAAALGRALKTSAVPSTPQPHAVTTSDVPSTQPSLETLEREAEAAGRAALSEPPQIELRVIEVETIPPRAAHTDPSPGMKRVPRGPVRSMPIAPERGGPIPQPLHKPPRHDTRRRFQRASYLTPVRVIRSGGHSFDARCEDISEGGLLLIGPHLIEDAEAIEVRFALPITGDVATVAATSRWVRAAREGRGAIGVEFHGLPAEMRQVIGNYVQFFSYDG
jgi:hypothetical protein